MMKPEENECEPPRARILIVDDEEVIREMFAACLEERYDCVMAANFEEAIAHLDGSRFELVITDVIMPGRGGVELLREVQARHAETAVIMASGVGRSQRVLDAVRLGAYDYLIKPVDLDTLELSVERALERRALLGNAHSHRRDLERWNEELRRSKAELERMQAQIVHSEKMASLGQLAAGVAHELNNPAGFIYGNMALLRERADELFRLIDFYDGIDLDPENAARAAALKQELHYDETLADLSSIIADCYEGAARICDVVRNLRTFSRLDEAEFTKVDIHEGIESTLRLLSRYYGAGRVELQRNYGELPPVSCYAGQLNQVWMNLLVNAAQAVGPEGRVSIETRRAGEGVTISISDTGCGIAPENLNKIFDPFFTTKPVGEGTGLGLSVTYGIIERHGGSISVESKNGQGTTFVVSIPIESPPQSGQHA